MSSSSSGNLNELEGKISELERVNFDLKMQLYYLNQKQLDNSVLESSIEVVEDDDIDLNAEIVQLKEEQEYSRRRMAELEAEILQLQILRENDLEMAAKAKPYNLAIIDDNRKREREAAIAIAEHDAAVIRKLQLEIEELQSQHELDKTLVNECAEKLAQQIELAASKDSIISELTSSLSELKGTDTLTIEDKPHPDSKYMDDAHYNFGDENISPPNGGDAPTSTTHSKSFSSRAGGTGESVGKDKERNMYDIGSGAYFRNEVNKLKAENEILRDQLARQKESIRNQEDALRRLSQSRADVSHMDSEEAARLEGELDRCIAEKEAVAGKCARLEAHIVTLHRQHEEELQRVASESRQQGDGRGLSRAASMNAGIDLERLRSEHAKTVEMYRQRETELLLALEGVVTRCQELEAQQQQYQQHAR